MFSDLMFRLRALFRREAVEAEMDEELRSHFEKQVEKLVAQPASRAKKRCGARGSNSADKNSSRKNAVTPAA